MTGIMKNPYAIAAVMLIISAISVIGQESSTDYTTSYNTDFTTAATSYNTDSTGYPTTETTGYPTTGTTGYPTTGTTGYPTTGTTGYPTGTTGYPTGTTGYPTGTTGYPTTGTTGYPTTGTHPPELCCDYESDTCGLIYTDWKWSAQYNPTPYSVPYYSGRYMWTNELNSQIWTQTITVTPLTIYSFMYYISTSSNRFYVKFRRANDGTVVSISSTSYSGYWESFAVNFANCGGCCDGLTCDGQLMIVVDGSYSSFVAAIDDFGRDNTCVPQYSTVPTLPPPVHHTCCLFESDVCDYTLFSWKWSFEYSPTYSVPPLSGNYIWTSTLDSQIVSATQSVEYATRFQFSYYLDSSSNYIYIYFREDATGDMNELTYYTYTSGGWRSVDVECYYDCCDSYPCQGELFITATGSDSSFVAAVDGISRDYACEEALPCCLFNDNSLCNFQTNNVDGYYWKSYTQYNPYYSEPYPGSPYVFFETVNYGGSQTLDVILESPTITINYNSVFTGNIFARDEYQQSSDTSLLISFYNDKTGESVQLDYVKDTSDTWKTIAFYCESTHGNCCPDNQCTGKLQIKAQVGSNGGTVFYGVDAFEIDNACSNFPSPTDSTDYVTYVTGTPYYNPLQFKPKSS